MFHLTMWRECGWQLLIYVQNIFSKSHSFIKLLERSNRILYKQSLCNYHTNTISSFAEVDYSIINNVYLGGKIARAFFCPTDYIHIYKIKYGQGFKGAI